MRINPIGVSTTFGNKQKLAKVALPAAGAAVGAAATSFVKGLSKPEASKEEFIRGNDDVDGCNPCDGPCDALCYDEAYNRKMDNMGWYNLCH